MEPQEFEARVAGIKLRAHGQWTEVLSALGVAEELLNRKNQPCPMCGGTDRFQYTDRFGDGNYHCRGCGAGGGLKLAQACLGISFTALLEQLERLLGNSAPICADAPGRARSSAGCTHLFSLAMCFSQAVSRSRTMARVSRTSVALPASVLPTRTSASVIIMRSALWMAA